MTAACVPVNGDDSLESKAGENLIETEEPLKPITRIEVLATDGSSVKRVLWICRTNGGIYAGLCLEGQDHHFTYHTDGTRAISRGGGTPKIVEKGPPLEEIVGFLQFTGFVFPAKLDKIHTVYPPYRSKKLDAVYFVDPSFFPHGGVACNIYLIQPNTVENLIRLPTRGVAHILTDKTPWIAMVFSHVLMR